MKRSTKYCILTILCTAAVIAAILLGFHLRDWKSLVAFICAFLFSFCLLEVYLRFLEAREKEEESEEFLKDVVDAQEPDLF